MEILFEMVLEGCAELMQNAKHPVLRGIAAAVLLVVYGGLVLLLAVGAIRADNALARWVMLACALFLLWLLFFACSRWKKKQP